MKRAALAIGIISILLATTGSASAVSADFAEGQKLFTQKNYRAAAVRFEAAMKANPRDGNTVYYCALSNQLSNNRSRARQLYEYLVSGFPGTQVANMASSALGQLGGAPSAAGSSTDSSAATTSASGSRSASASDTPRGVVPVQSPDEFRVPFTRGRGGHVYVDAQVNGQTVNFILDTGASTTGVDADRMAAMGLSRAARGDKFKVAGIGDDGNVKGWNQEVTLKLGPAYARNFPLMIQDKEAPPLLGQDFLRNFEIEIDPEKNEAVFRRKSAVRRVAVQPRGTVDIPFTIGGGGHLWVTAEINGRPCKMIFDTGASDVCFTLKALKTLGLEIPGDAREGQASGVNGIVKTFSFPVRKMKLGTIIKEDFEIQASESAHDVPPLLGQSFFGNYRCKVDQEAKVIHLMPTNQ